MWAFVTTALGSWTQDGVAEGTLGGGGTAGLRLNGLTSAYARGLWRREAHDPPVRSTVNAKIFLEVLFEEMLETNARTAEFVGEKK